jgi:hypothetical protein
LDNNELQRAWNDVAVTYLKVLARLLFQGTDENPENTLNGQCPSRDSNLTPPEYKSEALSF